MQSAVLERWCLVAKLLIIQSKITDVSVVFGETRICAETDWSLYFSAVFEIKESKSLKER